MPASRRSATLRGRNGRAGPSQPFRRAALSLAIGVGMSLTGGQAAAADLLDIYALAEQNDQQLRAAEQQRLSVGQNIPIQQADLLPQVGANAGLNYTHSRVLEGGFPGSSDTTKGTSRNLALTLSQTIYNRTENLQLDIAQLQVRQADIDYEQARQNLILRTGQAYFQVLNADAQLQLAKANRAALKRQLERAQRQYEVGLVAVTDVADAQSEYDQANAQIIAARNQLNNAEAALETIIGRMVTDLDDIRTNLDVARPEPADPTQWIELALTQNLGLQSAAVGTQINQQNVNVARSQRMPTVNLEGSYGYDSSPSQFGNRSETLNGQVGVQLNLPIYTGGRINARSRQAAFDYQRSQFDLDGQRRQVRQQTSDSYRGVETSISQIEAFRQSVESARTSLVATEAGYGVGTRTIVDVLNAELRVFQAMADYLDARYSYITNLLQLKADTGQLTVADLEAINRQLTDQETNALIAPLMGRGEGDGPSSADTEMMQRVLERARQTVGPAE
ncbi:TolC family outer membrane protein [Guyparkeria sp. 1SP6A2]|nr:TolC family outer membrane protein [Guyparkeria sp. 1SP6A2]